MIYFSLPASQPSCEYNEVLCKSGQCVSADKLCDGNRDCNDNSDEEGCPGMLVY